MNSNRNFTRFTFTHTDCTVTITNTLSISPAVSSLAWEVLPPAGWTYASGAGTEGTTRLGCRAMGDHLEAALAGSPAPV